MRLLLAIALALCALASHADERLKPALDAYARGQFDSARAAFERLSRQGVAAADYNLAVMHLRGERRDASVKEALRLMTRAAESGFVTAMVGLGELYERGHADLEPDLPLSVQWYRRGAEAGSLEAQLAVATAHYLGRGALYLYASMRESGDGIERDLAEARYWYAAAARNGEIGAAEKARAIETKLTEPSGR